MSPKPIGPQEKQAILAAAMRAPTAGNSMLYSILDVTDQDLKDKLAAATAGSLFDQQPISGAANPALADALAALKALGYKEREVKKIGKQLGEEQQSTDEYLRQALRLLNQ